MAPAWLRAGFPHIGRRATITGRKGGSANPAGTAFRRPRVDFRRCRARAPGLYALGHVLARNVVGADRTDGDTGTQRPGPSRHRGAQDSARLVRRRRFAAALGALILSVT